MGSLRQSMGMGLRKRLHPVGGLTGAVIAVAGGLGAAVGTYSLPAANHAPFLISAYAPGTSASAVHREPYGEDGYREIRVEAGRRTPVGADGVVGPDGSSQAEARAGTATRFFVTVTTCMPAPDPDEGEWCEWAATWQADLPPGVLEFDPALRSARFTGSAWCSGDCGDQEECTFDVRWTGEGEVIPAVDAFTDGAEAVDGHQRFNVGASAGVSRMAPADIDASCLEPLEDVPGYLSAGSPGAVVGAQIH